MIPDGLHRVPVVLAMTKQNAIAKEANKKIQSENTLRKKKKMQRGIH